jgi:hypothetical protein
MTCAVAALGKACKLDGVIVPRDFEKLWSVTVPDSSPLTCLRPLFKRECMVQTSALPASGTIVWSSELLTLNMRSSESPRES